MPVNVVRTPEDEAAWERAKEIVRAEYPDAHGERFYRLVMGIFKKMAHYQPMGEQRSMRRNRRRRVAMYSR
ncbi:MAG TPA: hypothetical protein VMU16_13835 [Candidatus Binataceae bacterium]|nr:hypothetical protein [Candidatus Binataceae bacterium]